MKDIFCARCQQVTPHKGSVDGNGEFVFECQNVVTPEVTDETGEVTSPAVLCGRFLKFPSDTTAESFPTLLQAHEEANKGQVSVEAQEETLKKLLA